MSQRGVGAPRGLGMLSYRSAAVSATNLMIGRRNLEMALEKDFSADNSLGVEGAKPPLLTDKMPQHPGQSQRQFEPVAPEQIPR